MILDFKKYFETFFVDESIFIFINTPYVLESKFYTLNVTSYNVLILLHPLFLLRGLPFSLECGP